MPKIGRRIQFVGNFQEMLYQLHFTNIISAIVAICKGKMLIVSPVCRSAEEKKNQYYMTTDGGAIVIHDSSDESV